MEYASAPPPPPYIPPPPPPRRVPWLTFGAVALVTALVVGYLVANLATTTKAAPIERVTLSPTPSPSPSPSPTEVTPVAPDPMDEAMTELHEGVYVQQFCNMADKSGIDYFARLIDIGKPWKTGSIGSAWVAAQNRTGDSIARLATEFYGRYC